MPTNSNLIIPVVNRNGTNRWLLVGEQVRAADALHAALAKMAEALPNGRNFPEGPASLAAATQQHYDRIRRVREVMQEYLNLAEAIEAQENWRDKE